MKMILKSNWTEIEITNINMFWDNYSETSVNGTFSFNVLHCFGLIPNYSFEDIEIPDYAKHLNYLGFMNCLLETARTVIENSAYDYEEDINHE